MGRELARFGLTGAIAFVIGLITGEVMACLLIAAVGMYFWQTRLLALFKAWLVSPKKHPFPDTDSVIQELVTEVERLRKSNRSRKRKLARYLKEFRTTFSAIPDAIVMIDDSGRIEWINPAAKKYFGIQWPRDSGNRINNIVRHPDFVQMFRQVEDKPEFLTTGFEVEIPSPAMADVILSITCSRYGKNAYLVMARDVTRLVEANQTRSDFVANVSHELRTPLTVLRGYLETLVDQPEIPEEFIKPLENMKHQSRRMEAIVEDLLFLSRLEHEPPPDFDEAIDIGSMLAEIQDSAQVLGGEKHQLIELEIDVNTQLLGNVTEIHSAFANLVFNAVKYSQERGVVRIKWHRTPTGGHFMVQDNGIGIAERHLTRLTERFYRVDSDRSRQKGGTGLGLAIVKHVLQRHRAYLTIESTLGEGSELHCHFPPELLIDKKLSVTAS
jgi:two-component system phosphate regulon sensor histidine kinase PhoR